MLTIKHATRIALCSGFLAIAACQSSQAEEQQKANAAQAEANQKAAKAQQEANEKAAKAQAEANDKERDVNTAFVKRRSDYQLATQKSLDDLDKKIDDLKVKSLKATGATKTAAESALRDVAARRDTLASDLTRMQSTMSLDWDAFKAKTDADLADLRKSIDAVKL